MGKGPQAQEMPPTSMRPRRGPGYLLIFILLVAFALRMLFFMAMVGHPDRFFQEDSNAYHRLAVNLVRFHRFGFFDEAGAWIPHVDRTPPYPAFLAAVYIVFGPLPAVAMIVQSLISTLTIALAYRLGRLWGSPYTGAVVAIFVSIETGSVLYANQVMTETLFNVVFLGGIVIYSEMIWQRRWQYGFLSGAMLGLATLIRPILSYFGPLAGLLSLLSYRGGRRQRWRAACSVVLAFFMAITPWMIRNYAVAGQARLSTVQPATLLFYNVRQLRALQQGISIEEARTQLQEEVQRETSDSVRQDEAALMAYYQQKALYEMRTHWSDYALVHLKGSLVFFFIPTAGTVARALGWVRTGTGLLSNLMTRGLLDTWQSFHDFRRQLSKVGYGDWLFFGAVGYELVYLFLLNVMAVWGSIRCLRARRWYVLLLAVAIIGYFALVIGPLSYDARYRIPAIPFLALLAAVAFPGLSRTPNE